MKTKLPLLFVLTSALGAPFLSAQDERRPAPPQPPESPRSEPGRERRPERPREPGTPDLERGPGRAEGGRRGEGERSFSPRGENAGREGGGDHWMVRPQKPTPFLGVMTAPVPAALGAQIGLPEGFGLVVEEVVPDSPATAAGVQRYDVIKLLNDQQLVDPNQLAALVRSLGKDKEISLTVLRQGQEKKLSLKIGERMLPERRPTILPLPNDFVPRLDSLRERGEDYARKLQEGMRGFQERMREYQEKLEKWQKDPGTSKMPDAPKLQVPDAPKTPDAPRPPEPPRPGDLLREVRPGGAPQVRIDQDGAVTTWNTAQARVVVKDESGEVEIRTDDGHRTIIARNPAGETVFSGPVDTEEQRRALPEPARRALEKIRVQGASQVRIESPVRPGAFAEGGAEAKEPRPLPPPARGEREIQ